MFVLAIYQSKLYTNKPLYARNATANGRRGVGRIRGVFRNGTQEGRRIFCDRVRGVSRIRGVYLYVYCKTILHFEDFDFLILVIDHHVMQ